MKKKYVLYNRAIKTKLEKLDNTKTSREKNNSRTENTTGNHNSLGILTNIPSLEIQSKIKKASGKKAVEQEDAGNIIWRCRKNKNGCEKS